jgi:hypothetical protein
LNFKTPMSDSWITNTYYGIFYLEKGAQFNHKALAIMRFISSRPNRITTSAVLLTICLALGVLTHITLIAPGKSHVSVWLNHVFGLIDAANHSSIGEVPNIYFHSVYGPLVAWIPGLGLHIGFNYSTIFAFNGLIVSSLVLFCGLIILPKRFNRISSLSVFVFAWMLIVIPTGDGNNYHDISWGIFYNRQAWAASILTLAVYVDPEHSKTGDRLLD